MAKPARSVSLSSGERGRKCKVVFGNAVVELGKLPSISAENPTSGRRQRRFFNVKGTKRDAEKALAEAIHLRDTGLDVLPSKMTVGSYLLRWIRDYAATNVAASTFVRYESIVRKHLLPELGMVPLEDLRPAHIQAAYAHFLGGHGTADSERPLSVRTVLQHHRVLREALRHAVQWQLLSRKPGRCSRATQARNK